MTQNINKGWMEEMVDHDFGGLLESFKERISGFEKCDEIGWGKGISSLHLKKIIYKDETVFTTTWAELRCDLFQRLIPKIFPSLGNIKVPLPCHSDGSVLTDRDIREKVKNGYMLMFYPITRAWEFNGSSLINLGLSTLKNINQQRYEKEWLSEIDQNSRNVTKPYWYWINCSKNGSSFWSKRVESKSPTFTEYVIAAYVFRNETGNHLDIDNYTWLRHYCRDTSKVILGGRQPKKVKKGHFINVGDTYVEREQGGDFPSRRFPIRMRFTEVVN